ncbi:MAG: ribosomal-protein-alanine N-acetyltransferase [Ruminococcaceae bacterium]|nr:ribosomal-protein-alanine N-acetyltransferase [Oscillospiraceae bacterium]
MTEHFAALRLTPEWAPRLHEIELACFTVPWSEAAFEGDLAGPFAEWTGIYDGKADRLAAFLGTHVILDEAEIVNVATHPDYRRLGLARWLLQDFFDTHPALSQSFLEVRESNTPARTLYASFGFVPYAVRRNYYEKPTENAILMRRVP